MLALTFLFLGAVNAEEQPGVDQETTAQARIYLTEVLSTHAKRYEAWGRPEVELRIAPEAIAHREGFQIETRNGVIQITGGGYGGAIYGAQGLGRLLEKHEELPAELNIADEPDFNIRGATIYFMNAYLAPVPEYFHEREFLTEYLDYIHENRFNTLFVWHGHLFPQIMELPEYPDATDLSPEEVARNEAQFRWLTDECAKRNIDVLLHFYNILIPPALAESRGMKTGYSKPNEFAAKYIGYTLERFMREFQSVGLYICPGEALDPKYQEEWFRDVIFAAAKRSGKNPLLVVRGWHTSSDLLESLSRNYNRVYTEYKHNDELIMSPFAHTRHKGFLKYGQEHIANMHLMADVKPFRWGSWRYIHDIVSDWKTIGLSGGEVQHLVNWPWRGPENPYRGSWPYSMDKLEPHQERGARHGRKLKIYERDWIWYDAFARYLWDVDRDPAQEQVYWRSRLEERFGTAAAAEALDEWYRVSGPILPSLKNLTLPIGGYATTATGHRTTIDGLTKESRYWIRPLDPLTFDRYRRRFGLEKPYLSEPETSAAENTHIPYPLRVYYYVQKKLEGEDLSHYVTPVNLTQVVLEMAEESLEWAEKAKAAATENEEEAARFVTDSEALVLIARVYQHRIKAAIAKRMIMDTGEKERYAGEFVRQMDAAIAEYEKLDKLTDRTYVFCSELRPERLNWDYSLQQLREEREEQKKWLETYEKPEDKEVN